MKSVGQRYDRVDARGKVTGEAKYTADLEPKDCLRKGHSFYYRQWPGEKLSSG